MRAGAGMPYSGVYIYIYFLSADGEHEKIEIIWSQLRYASNFL